MEHLEHWKGIGKLVEECGEVLQICGKAVAFPVGPHPDGQGPIATRLVEELADLKAAIQYFEHVNDMPVGLMSLRQREKFEKFTKWGLTGIVYRS